MNVPGGKGSASRPLSVPREVYENNFDRIFNKDKIEEALGCRKCVGEACKSQVCSNVYRVSNLENNHE